MKKTLILMTALLFAIGFASAQEVYFAGNHNGTAGIWKNDSLIISLSDSLSLSMKAMQATPDGMVFGAGFVHDTAFDFVQGRVWLNDSVVFMAGTNTVVNALILNGNDWTAAGIGENEWSGAAGLVWQNGELLFAYNDSIADNHINAMTIDTANGDVYSGGFVEDSLTHASIWKNDALFWQEDSASIVGLAHDGTDLYAIGKLSSEGVMIPVLWKNGSIIFSINDLGVNASFAALSVYDGNAYMAGLLDDALVIWQNDEVLYDHAVADDSEINALVVNEFGVYYAGKANGTATVWKDGEILYQPEDCDVVSALCVLPSTPLPSYSLTVLANDTLYGSVAGNGIYPMGDTATIEAFPNLGCEFLYWNDSVTDNPRDVIILSDSTFTAHFGLIDYLIEAYVSPEGTGTVTGGGLYHYGDTATLEASPLAGYEFLGWSDSIADNPRDVVVNADSLFTALFGLRQCTVTTSVSPIGAGNVTGGGTFEYGTTIQLEATANTGHDFMQWSDGVTDNPRTVAVETDTTFTALFSTYQYEIVVAASPQNAGIVEGGGSYDHGAVASLTARAYDNYTFMCWHDGSTANPRNVVVTSDSTFTALFSQNAPFQYTITVEANDPRLGSVDGGGTFDEGSLIEISATPADDAIFTGWDDGNTDNPRGITVTHDQTFTALFEPLPRYTIHVSTDTPESGSVYGSGVYFANATVTIGAVPNEGFHFAGWHDGIADNPRNITVSCDSVFVATFSPNPISTYTVTVYYDESQGFVIGGGTYTAGRTASLAAIPAEGYLFKKWSDGTTDNPKEILVDQDIVMAAFFDMTDIEEHSGSRLGIYPNPSDGNIRIVGLEEATEVSVFNVYGVLVKTAMMNDGDELSVDDLPAGIYVVGIGRLRLKLVVN